MRQVEICKIETCTKKVQARGLCSAHYKKLNMHGDPLHGKTRERKNGYGTITFSGYIAVMVNGKKKQQHVLAAELAMGKELPSGAVVHHINKIRTDNRNENLVICQDQTYHQLIHTREKAFDACGNANYRKCKYCKMYDDPSLMKMNDSSRSGISYHHRNCRNEHIKAKK